MRKELQLAFLGVASFLSVLSASPSQAQYKKYNNKWKPSKEWKQNFWDLITPDGVQFTGICHHWEGSIEDIDTQTMAKIKSDRDDLSRDDIYDLSIAQMEGSIAQIQHKIIDPEAVTNEDRRKLSLVSMTSSKGDVEEYNEVLQSALYHIQRRLEDIKDLRAQDNGQYKFVKEEIITEDGTVEGYEYKLVDEDISYYNERANWGVLLNYNLGSPKKQNYGVLTVGAFRNSYFRWAFTATVGMHHDFKKVDGLGVAAKLGFSTGYKRSDVDDIFELGDNTTVMGAVEVDYQIPNSRFGLALIVSPDFIAPSATIDLNYLTPKQKAHRSLGL